jgi:hypothetical protein
LDPPRPIPTLLLQLSNHKQALARCELWVGTLSFHGSEVRNSLFPVLLFSLLEC